MKLLIAVFIGCCLSLCACQSDSSQLKKSPQLADTAKFYPLAVFFQKQVEYVDLRSFPLYRISIIDGKKDSAGISKDEFIQWADVFIRHSFADPKLKAAYKETVFEDLSTDSYTINYTPHDATSVAVQNIDILINQQTSNIKRVFIKSLYKKADTTIEEQCSWKADKSLQVTRVKQDGKGKRSTELHFINWNDKPL